MENKYLTKVSNALTRVLNSGMRGLSSAAPTMQSAAARSAFSNTVSNVVSKGGSKSLGSALGSKAVAMNAGKMPSSFLNKSLSSGKVDPLTESLGDRLAKHRKTLGLPSANGNRSVQIENANKLREAGKSGKLNLTGAGPKSPVAQNQHASNINKALVDAKAGHQTHLEMGLGKNNDITSTLSSSRPPEVAKMNPILSKAKDLLAKGKQLASSPTGKKVLVGGAALGTAGAVINHRLNKQQESYQYGYQ